MSQEPAVNEPHDRQGIAEVAYALINQHLADCGHRYAELQRQIAARFETVEHGRDARHAENVRRLDAQDATLTRILWMLFGVAGSLIVGLAGVAGTLIHFGGHL